jgi:transcriptional regulator with XRE-family HTH domain
MIEKIILTKSQKIIIRRNSLKMSQASIAKKIGVGETIVSRYMRENGLTAPKEYSIKFRIAFLKGRTTATKADDKFLKKHYLKMGIKTMAKAIGRSDCLVRGRLRQLGLIQPPEVIEKIKQESRIKPGTVSWNKGKEQASYMSAEAIERTKATRFKKGNVPGNAKENDGAITLRQDHPERGGSPYYYIRISLGKWKPLHQHKWEEKNGPVPKGMCLWFIDQNTLNTDPDNLELITRAENMKRNSASLNLSDGYIAFILCGKKNMHLFEDILKNKELIEVRRQQLLLSRKIKSLQNK